MKTDKFEIIAKTLQGVEEILAEEIAEIGGEEITIGRRMVSFKGDKELLYKANFRCRTALKILKPIYKFEARDTDELYRKAAQYEWENILTPKSTFAIDSVVYSDDFRHSKFAAYRVKDAIADRFTDKYGARPSVSLTNADILINLHISGRECTLSLDSSGESLHKRGYRTVQTEAPINEVLAAAMLKMAGWDGSSNLLDPMCGSGTILIEAALIATNTPPGIYRQGYAFERWNDFDAELLNTIYNDDRGEKEFNYKIYGCDISPRAIEIARSNIKNAHLEKYIETEVCPIQEQAEPHTPCLIVTNPPYGERLAPRDLADIYKALGSKLKHLYTGGEAWIISSSQEGFNNIGLKPSERHRLMNGQLECEYRKYELFGGKYKDAKTNKATGKQDDKPAPRKHESDKKQSSRPDKKEKPGKAEKAGKTHKEETRPKQYGIAEKQAKSEKPYSPKKERTNTEQAETPSEKKEMIHGEEFMTRFIKFRKPSLINDGETQAKQFRKRKKKEEGE